MKILIILSAAFIFNTIHESKALACPHSQQATLDYTFTSDKSGQPYTIHCVKPGKPLSSDLRRQITYVVTKGLAYAYKDLTPRDLGIENKFPSIDSFLANLVKKELELFDEGKREFFYVTQASGNTTGASPERVIAFLAVVYEQGDIHLTELSVDPNFQRQGIATNLIEYVRTLYPEARLISLETRLVNPGAQTFFQNLNFDRKGAPRTPYSPDHYVSFQKNLN